MARECHDCRDPATHVCTSNDRDPGGDPFYYCDVHAEPTECCEQVVETPTPRVLSVTSCADCPFADDGDSCTATGRSLEGYLMVGDPDRPTWCPLESAGVLVRVAREGE